MPFLPLWHAEPATCPAARPEQRHAHRAFLRPCSRCGPVSQNEEDTSRYTKCTLIAPNYLPKPCHMVNVLVSRNVHCASSISEVERLAIAVPNIKVESFRDAIRKLLPAIPWNVVTVILPRAWKGKCEECFGDERCSP